MNIPRVINGCARSIVLAGLLWAGPAGAQTQNGEVVGLVTESSGAVLVNATINILNLETNRSVAVRSNGSRPLCSRSVDSGDAPPYGLGQGFCHL